MNTSDLLGTPRVEGSISWHYIHDPDTKFCIFCNTILHDWACIKSPEDVRNVLKSGHCWFERRVCSAALDFTTDQREPITKISVRGDIGGVYLCLVTVNDGAVCLEIYVGSDIQSKAISLSHAVSQEALRLDLAVKWVQQCTKGHVDCSADVAKDPQLPSRVLDLCDIERSGEARLLSPKSQSGRYVALSHCWGRAKPPETTRANFRANTNGIQVASLPKTFHEAIMVCQFLNVRYLWIDSLCIIQDDEKDWHTEADNMGGIYENSFITIAATGSWSCEHGFLAPRDYRTPREYPVPCTNYTEAKIGNIIFARRQINHSRLNEPLHRRAWCLQEWILPKRLLSFEGKEFIYICRNGRMSDSERMETTTEARRIKIGQLVNNKDDNVVHREWANLVVEYMERSISRPSDRLPAIAGLAGKFHELLHEDEYLSGTWRNNLAQCLAWYVQKTEEMEMNLDAPSWSWASVNKRVGFKHVIQCDPEPLNLIKAIPGTGGAGKAMSKMKLQVCGRIAPVHLHYAKDGNSYSVRIFPYKDEIYDSSTCPEEVRVSGLSNFIKLDFPIRTTNANTTPPALRKKRRDSFVQGLKKELGCPLRSCVYCNLPERLLCWPQVRSCGNADTCEASIEECWEPQGIDSAKRVSDKDDAGSEPLEVLVLVYCLLLGISPGEQNGGSTVGMLLGPLEEHGARSGNPSAPRLQRQNSSLPCFQKLGLARITPTGNEVLWSKGLRTNLILI